MSTREGLHTLVYTATSPATPSTAVASPFGGLEVFDELIMDVSLTGGTGGTLDIYLQREVGASGSTVWVDWYKFTQLAAAATYKATLTSKAAASSATVVGVGNLGTPSVAIADTTLTCPAPMGRIRYVFIAGASTSAGAAQYIRFTGRKVWRR